MESDEAASELAHLPLRRMEAAVPPSMQPGMAGLGAIPGMQMPSIANAARPAPAEEPELTPAELAAFESLKTPNLARMNAHRRELEEAMRQAADLPAEQEEEEIENAGPGGVDCEASSRERCRCKGGQSKGTTREGKDAGKRKPFVHPESRKPVSFKSITEGWEETRKTGRDSLVGRIGKYAIRLELGYAGDPNDDWKHGHGLLHIQAKHPEITPEALAKDIVSGKRKMYHLKDKEGKIVEHRLNMLDSSMMAVFAPTKRENELKLITAYKNTSK